VAIIVNKEEKRHNIAFSCKEILLEQGIKNITIAQIAKTAGVGKGTIYEYFDNKEEIVFEIITTFISEYEKDLRAVIAEVNATKEKVFHFLYKIYEDEHSDEKISTYREFIAISLTSDNHDMIAFDTQVRVTYMQIMQDILSEGIQKGEIKAESLALSSALLTFSLGLLVNTKTAGLKPKEEISLFLNTLFPMMQTLEQHKNKETI